jgi:hypothetical protein
MRTTYKTPSGDTLYFSHSTSHSASVIGGRIPVNGSHSVILNPDSVNLVNPPMMTIPKTSDEHPNSQLGSDRGMACDVVGTAAGACRCGGNVDLTSNAAVVKLRKEGEKKVEFRATGWNRCE